MRFARFLFRNLSIKIVALLAASIIWLFAVLERNQVTSMVLPVKVDRIPPGMLVAGMDTTHVLAELSGQGRELLMLKLRKPAFALKLTSETPGRVHVKLSQEQSNLPAGIQVVLAKPEYINVDLDAQARRLMKVVVPIRDKPPKGYVVTSAKALDNVYVSGPEDEIELLSQVSTESISVADPFATDRRRVRVVPPPGLGFHAEPESVNVAVKVETEATRTFGDVTVSVLRPASRAVSVKPDRAQITVSGATDAVRAMTLQAIGATLKITDTIPRGEHQLPCEISLPPGIMLVKCDPPFFDVNVR
jgi:YbbR domain-containing protein